MPHARVGDIRIHYEVEGRGQPLILIASMGTDLGGWRLQRPEFAGRYRVVTFDNRGWGQSDAPEMPYSIAMMADDTVGLMDALGIDRAHVLGKSMGGYIAQEVAIRHPGRVRSLVLVSTSAGPHVAETPILRGWAEAAMKGVSRRAFCQLMLPFIFSEYTFEDPEMVDMAIEMIGGRAIPKQGHTESPQSRALRSQFIACVEHYARGRLNRVNVPTLVMAGRDEFFIPLELCRELAASIPNARLAILESGGHALNEDIPEEFNRTVLSFLGDTA
ncbi:MAG: alpha/beta fold hydrolase [Chloroflexi bacterium]|nr:alpha/beta fold hydrolase [Chloroflexota bacterium]